MQYRSSYLTEVVWAVAFTASTFLLWEVITSRFVVPEWGRAQLYLFVAFGELYYGLFRGVAAGSHYLSAYVHSGRLDVWLLRPVEPRLVMLAQCAEPIALIRGVVMFIFWAVLGAAAGAELHAVSFFAGLLYCAAAAGVFGCLYFSINSMAFYVTKTEALNEVLHSTTDATKYPTTTFPEPLAGLLTVLLPVALCATIPALVVSGKLPVFAPLPLFLVLLLTWYALMQVMWKKGLAAYDSPNA